MHAAALIRRARVARQVGDARVLLAYRMRATRGARISAVADCTQELIAQLLQELPRS
jgi:ribosomal protein S19E (S16A)